MSLTVVDQGLLGTYAQYTGFKNRIINGNMTIDQRNAGASVTPSTGTYTLDRWKLNPSQASKITVQQTPSATETGYATRVGAGFSSYLACTTASAATVGAADYFQLSQAIEGLNISDLAWGTASAKPVTLSFWAYSSLTGTFGGSLSNNGQAVGYAFSYAVPTANTWTNITITIPGPTTGTWLTTNGIGLLVIFNLGCGSNYFGTANTWVTQNYINSPSGCVNMVATAGATFYITGVQVELGSTATSFDRRPYGTELALCQRYYIEVGVRNGSGSEVFVLQRWGGNILATSFSTPVTMRATPTGTLTGSYTCAGATSQPALNSLYGVTTVTNNGVAVIYNSTIDPSATNNYSGLGATTSTKTALSAEL